MKTWTICDHCHKVNMGNGAHLVCGIRAAVDEFNKSDGARILAARAAEEDERDRRAQWFRDARREGHI